MASPIDVVKRVYAAFRDRDEAAMLAIVHPDFEFWPVTAEELGRTEPYRGLEGMRQYLADAVATWEELAPSRPGSTSTATGSW